MQIKDIIYAINVAEPKKMVETDGAYYKFTKKDLELIKYELRHTKTQGDIIDDLYLKVEKYYYDKL